MTNQPTLASTLAHRDTVAQLRVTLKQCRIDFTQGRESLPESDRYPGQQRYSTLLIEGAKGIADEASVAEVARLLEELQHE